MLSRTAGVLIPLSALRTLESLERGEILDLTAMVDFAREMGLGLIQLLPLDEGAPEENSPYSAMSVFAVDPVYLSLSALRGVGRASLAQARQKLAGSGLPLGRTSVRAAKLPMLERAWRASVDFSAPTPEFEAYRARNCEWLDDYSLFRALKDRYEWSSWVAWPAELRDRDPAALAAVRHELAEPIARYSWFQFIADRQWSEVRAYASQHRVMLGGDMAFSPSLDSAEVWANQNIFDLHRTIGTPPDAFNERGQRWGLPVPRWDAMRPLGFKLWRLRIKRAASMFDLVRVDHVVGIYRTFCFGSDPEAPGAFVPSDETAQVAQGEEILHALRDSAGGCSLIAEDLGSVPPWVRASLAAMGIPGYKVMPWEREGWDTAQERFLSPADYPELSLATTGTHDTETLTTWWLRQPEDERAKLADALGVAEVVDSHQPLNEAGLDAIIGALYASPARLVVLPIQDLFGWSDQINYPGTVSDNNWSYRLPFTLRQRARVPEVRSRIRHLQAIARESGRG